MTSSFSVDDLITKRLTIDGQRIQQLDLGALVVSDPTYGIGIGTDTPRLRLDISGTNGIRIPVGTTGERPQIGVNDIVDLSGVLRYNTTLNQYEAWALDGWQALGGSSLQLYTKEQGTNPTIKLTKEITTYGSNDDGGIIEFCLKNQSNSLTYQARISALDSTNNAGYGSLVFSTSGGGNPQERMRIDHLGNVGISDNLTVGGVITGAVMTTGTQSIGGLKTFTSNTTIETNDAPNFKISNTATGGYMYLEKKNNGKAYVLNQTDHDLILGANHNLSQLVLKNDGNMEIGNNCFIGFNASNTEKQVLRVTAGVHRISLGGNGNNTYIKAHAQGDYNSPSYLDIIGYTIYLTANSGNGVAVKNNETIIGFSNNQLVVDSAYVNTSTPGMEFSSNAFFLLKKTSPTTHWNMIMDKGDNFWSGFTNSRDWDCYNDSDKYNRNATGATMFLQYYSHGNISMCQFGGKVGIGNAYPLALLHVAANSNFQTNDTEISALSDMDSVSFLDQYTYQAQGASFLNFSTASNVDLSIYAEGMIFSSTYVGASDKRIKKNITEIDDERSLIQLRNLPCVDYEYIDNFKNGEYKTVGFIAQDVKEIMPNCVKKVSDIIPNVMKKLENIEYEEVKDNEKTKYKLLNQNLEECSYRFYVKKDASSNEIRVELEYPFLFDKKYEQVYCYGKRVDDFLAIDKNKIFAIGFSATQQIDRIQQQHAIEIENIKAELQKEKTKLEEQTTKLEEQTTKLTNLIEQLKANNTIN